MIQKFKKPSMPSIRGFCGNQRCTNIRKRGTSLDNLVPQVDRPKLQVAWIKSHSIWLREYPEWY